MNYKRCSEVDRLVIHQAFLSGYADYAIPMNIQIEPFFERFFGSDGNRLENSFIAFQYDEPVGLILGGIRTFDGYRNLRCGTLCVTPEYRGVGVSQALLRLFMQNGIDQHCDRFSLEVLSENSRAIRFYEKQGFKKSNTLIYFSKAMDDNHFKQPMMDNIMIKEVDLSVAKEVRNGILSTHINWQNEVESFMQDKTAHCFAAYVDKQIVGALVITDAGIIYFLYVYEEERHKGIASNLLSHAIDELNLKKLSISMPDNIGMAEFIRKNKFKKDNIEQFEMYRMVR